ncbi:MAG: D-alanyl-D-alanine carboxypeptidase family protein [Parvularcula sp.]
MYRYFYKLALFAAFIGQVVLGLPAMAQTYFSTKAPMAILVDGKTGKVLFSKNADEPIPPASMTKLMTAAIVLERLDAGLIRLDTKFPVSEKAWRTGGSKMFVLVDTEISVENLLKGLLVQSGNDAAVVLAENIAGSVDGFVDLMNEKASEWGLDESEFVNPMGEDAEHQKMSVRDIAKLSRKIWYDWPDYQYLFGIKRFTWSDIDQPNRNPLLSTFEGADGLKTGHTDEAGWSLAGTAERDGERRFLVVAGLKTSLDRSREATRLMEIAFQDYQSANFFQRGEEIAKAEVFGGRKAEVPLLINADVAGVLHRRQIERAEGVISYVGPLPAPIRQGDQVGVLRVTIPDEGTTEYPLYAGEAVRELGVLAKMKLGVKLLFTPPEEPLF